MTYAIAQVLTTVNAPYGGDLTAHQLAALIVDPGSADACSAPVFAFFSEVSPKAQNAFIAEMGVSRAKARMVATKFSQLSGHVLPLAA